MITQDLYKVKVMTQKNTIDLKVKTSFPLHGVKSGDVVTVDVDADGVPLNKNWRKRFIDSKLDGCVEVVNIKTTKKDVK